MNGLRRSAGLHLLNFAMNLSFSHLRFFDMIQWLQGSLRDNQMRVKLYSAGAEGSGDNVEQAIKDQMALIIERILDVLRNETLNSAD